MDLLKYLEDNNFPSGVNLQSTTHREFRKELLKETEFLSSFFPTVRFGLRLMCVVEGITSVPFCVCGNRIKSTATDRSRNPYYKIRFADFCSSQCAARSGETKRKKREAFISHYGATSFIGSVEGKEQVKQTNLKKYGVEHPSLNREVVEKRKKTTMERFGFTTSLKHPDVIEKCKQTNIERFGVENYNQSAEAKQKHKERNGGINFFETDEFKIKQQQAYAQFEGGHPMRDNRIVDKMKLNSIDKYGVLNPNQSTIPLDVLDILESKEELSALYEEKKNIQDVADFLGVHFSSVQRYMSRLGIDADKSHMISRGEIQIAKYLTELGIPFVLNTREIINGEIDVYVPLYKLAIEFNGVYWHSGKFKPSNYHQEKSLSCKEKDILLIHVWEDDWLDENKQNIIKNKIKSKLGLCPVKIAARKCEVGILNQEEARLFMSKNHIQGKTTSSLWLGLRYQNEVVACMGMKKTKTEGTWDLVRYATSETIVGGFSKIFSYFKKNYKWSEVFTYAALDYSHGGLYEKTGFTKSHITPPGLWYVYNGKRLRREKFMKHKLKDKLECFDETLTEKQNMLNHGFETLYDSGSIKYVMKNTN